MSPSTPSAQTLFFQIDMDGFFDPPAPPPPLSQLILSGQYIKLAVSVLFHFNVGELLSPVLRRCLFCVGPFAYEEVVSSLYKSLLYGIDNGALPVSCPLSVLECYISEISS